MTRFRYRAVVQVLLIGILATMPVGCAPGPPIVSNPREPWEQDAERAMVRSYSTPTPTPYESKRVEQKLDDGGESDRSPLVAAMADIIGFPFRAVGWLAHVLL